MYDDFGGQIVDEGDGSSESIEINDINCDDNETKECNPVAEMPAMDDFLFRNWMWQLLRTLEIAMKKNTKEETDRILEELISNLHVDMY